MWFVLCSSCSATSRRSSLFVVKTWMIFLLQFARTITNIQQQIQQIQQHQRQLYQALLMKQQQLPSHSSSSSSSAGLHPPGGPAGGPGKSTLDPFAGPHQAPGLTDTLHTKEPPSSPNAYSTYPLCKSWAEAMFPWHFSSCVSRSCAVVNVTGMCLCFVCSWTESKHECKRHGRWGTVPEGVPPAPIPPVPMDTLELNGQPLWQLLKYGE